MPPNLTEIEQKILSYMVEYLRTNTYQPSIREIGERFGIKSTKTVSEHLQGLADKGCLERDPSRSRAVKIVGMDLSDTQGVAVPCFTALPEDRFAQHSNRAETVLTLDRRLAGDRGAFFVEARADDLAPLGCTEGDYILVEPSSVGDLPDGVIVAARVEDRPGYYRFTRNGQGIQLHPLTGKAPPTQVQDPGSLVLLGRVIGMYRRVSQVAATATAFAH
jgi:repressor LexA